MLKTILFNVLKHKVLYILIGLVAAVLAFYLVVGLNAVFSISESLKRAVSDNLTGDLIITDQSVKSIDYISRSTEKEAAWLKNPSGILDFLKTDARVKAAVPRLRYPGLVRTLKNRVPMVITGIDPALEATFMPGRTIDEGSFPLNQGGTALYYRHMDHLSGAVGEDIGITVVTPAGYPVFSVHRIEASFDYSSLDYYTEFARQCFIPLSDLNGMLGLTGLQATEILVRLKNPADTAALAGALKSRYGADIRLYTPQQASPLISGIYQLTHFIIWFVSFILLLLVFLCSSFIVSLSIETRRQEIGIYQAMGVAPWKIGLLFSSEFFIVMALFSIIGAIAGGILTGWLSTHGIKATIIPLHLVFGRPLLNITARLSTIPAVFGLLFLSFMSNVIYAIVQLTRLDPVEVMREV